MIKKHITKLLILTGFLSVAFASTTIPDDNIIPPDITLENGRTITFPYTDSLENETIHIYTDKSHYNDNVKQAEIYFAIEVEKKQEIDFGVVLNEKYSVSNIEMLIPQVRTIYTPVYKEECEMVATTTATSSEPIMQEVCTSELVRTDETYEDYYGLDSELFLKKEKEIDAKDKYKITQTVNKGTHYGKIIISITENVKDEEFWLFAIDENGVESILDPWFSSSWTYKKEIQIDSSKVDATLSSYPVYLDLSDMGSNFFDNAKADGCDIRIVESDDSTETAFELVSYDAGTDTGELHFMADSVSSSATTTFYIYYGNSGASCYGVADTYGRNNVWSDYAGAWHLEGNSDDSTGNGNDGSDTDVSYGTSYGKNGQGGSFNGTSSVINLGDNVSTRLTTVTNQAWARVPSAPSSWKGIFARNHGLAPLLSFDNEFLTYSWNTPSGEKFTGISASVDTWYSFYVSCISGSTNNTKGYIDGTLKVTDTASEASFNSNLLIGAISGGGTQSWGGSIDEVRTRGSILSVDWITTEYNNQNSPSTFYYVGTQEEESAEAPFISQDVIFFD